MNIIEFSYDKIQKVEKKIRYDSLIIGDNYNFKFKRGYRKLNVIYDFENLFVNKRKSINKNNKKICLKDISGINFNTAFVINKLNSNSKISFQKYYLLNKIFDNKLYIQKKYYFLFDSYANKNIYSNSDAIFSKIYDKSIFYYRTQDTSRKVPFGTISQEDTRLNRELSKINYDDIKQLKREVTKILIFDVINLKINSTRRLLEDKSLSLSINDKFVKLLKEDISVYNTSKSLYKLNYEDWFNNSNKNILKNDSHINIYSRTKNIYNDNTHSKIKIKNPKILLNKYFTSISKEICKMNIIANIYLKYEKTCISKYETNCSLSKSVNNLQVYKNIYLSKPTSNVRLKTDCIIKKEDKALDINLKDNFFHKKSFNILLDDKYKFLYNKIRQLYINKCEQITNKDTVKGIYTLTNVFIGKWNPKIYYFSDDLFMYKNIESLKKMNCFEGMFKENIYVNDNIFETFLKEADKKIFKYSTMSLMPNNKTLYESNNKLSLQTYHNELNIISNTYYNKKNKKMNIYKYDNFYNKYNNKLSINKNNLLLYKHKTELTFNSFDSFLHKSNKKVSVFYFDKYIKKNRNKLYIDSRLSISSDKLKDKLFINKDIFIADNYKEISINFDNIFAKNVYKNLSFEDDNLFTNCIIRDTAIYDVVFTTRKFKKILIQNNTYMVHKVKRKISINIFELFLKKKNNNILINDSYILLSKDKRKIKIFSNTIFASKKYKNNYVSINDIFISKIKKNICNFGYEYFMSKSSFNINVNNDNILLNKTSKNINTILNNALCMQKGSKNIYKIDTIVSTKNTGKDIFINTKNILVNKFYKDMYINKNITYVSKLFKDVYVSYDYNGITKGRKESFLAYKDILLSKNRKSLGISYVNVFTKKNRKNAGILYNNIFSNKKYKNTSILYVNTFINKLYKNTGILYNDCFAKDKYIPISYSDTVTSINKFAKDINIENCIVGVNKNRKNIKNELFNLYASKKSIKISPSYSQVLLNKFNKKINKDKFSCMIDIKNTPLNDLTINSLWINKNPNRINESKKDDNLFANSFRKYAAMNNNINASNHYKHSMVQYKNNDASRKIKRSMIQYNNKTIDNIKRDVMISYDNLFVEVIHFNDGKRPEFKLSGNIDELIMPYKDYNYKVFDLINDDGTINFKYVKRFDSNTGEYIIKSPIEHPIPIYSNIARNYIDLDTGILEQCIYYCKERWNKMMFKYSAMSAKDSIFDILKYMKENIDFNFSSDPNIYEQALRCLQLFRWYGEMAILNNCEYSLKFLTEDLKTNYADLTLGEMEEYITLDNFKISDSSYTIEPIDKNKKAKLRIYCPENDDKNEVFIKILLRSYDCNFTIYKDGVVNEAIRYPDVTGWHYGGIQSGMSNELIVEYIPQNSDSCIYISDIELKNVKLKTFDLTYKGVFGESNKVLNDMMERIFVFGEIPDRIKEELSDVYPVTVAVDRLQQYFELHHKDKLKGKRLITKK